MIQLFLLNGGNVCQAKMIERHVKKMESWQKSVKGKIPDIPDGELNFNLESEIK